MELYAFKDPYNNTSSSGGAFPVLLKNIEKIRKCRPVVYGAAFDDNFNVVHIRAVTEEDFQRLRGSKYVCSDLNDSIFRIIEDLNNNKIVVFSGTPCQVAAVKRKTENMTRKTENLYLIDIVCHGTPKSILWNDFKKWLENKEKGRLIDFSFRYRQSKWKSYPTMAKFDNGKMLVNSFKLRRYTELFYSDLALNERCYKCKYANLNRISDITIGDFWGIRRVLPEFPYKEEVSQILVNTEKGKRILSPIFQDLKYSIQNADINWACKYQESFLHPTFRKKDVDKFWTDYKKMSFEKVLSTYAEYNIKGYIKHIFKKALGNTGSLYIIKNILRK